MAHEILSLKLCELEDRLGRLNSRIHISETADHDRLKQEIKALSDENAETELTLRNKLDLSKSEIVKILADAYTQINHILETTNSKIERQAAKEQTPESTAESKILLAEYALDFAAQAADQALLLSLRAIDAQLQEEGKIE